MVKNPKEACSSFIATGHMTKDGGIVLGHNTMSSYMEALANVGIDIKPTQGCRILMQTQVGFIHSLRHLPQQAKSGQPDTGWTI